MFINAEFVRFNPISAGVLENQDMLWEGGVNLMSKYDKWYIIWKLLCSTFRFCKKMCKFAKIEFFIAKSSYIVKMFEKKICPKNEKLYTFEKPLTMPFQICKKFCKILNNLIFNQKKLKMCKFPLTGCLQKISHNLCNSFPYVKDFPKS